MGTKVNFSSNDDIIEITEMIDQLVINDPDDYFEIQRCVDFVKKNNYQRVVLQFPDELMNYSKYVHDSIANAVNGSIYILADTSYGTCCVDEVAASHVNADSIIHFGQSCLSLTENLPVLYIFGKAFINEIDLLQKFSEKFSDELSKIWLFYDVCYYHCIKEMSNKFSSLFPNLVVTELRSSSSFLQTNGVIGHGNSNEIDDNTKETQYVCCFGRSSILKYDVSCYDIIYIGGETRTLRNLIFKFNRNKVYSYNPSTCNIKIENVHVNKSLMKRYFLIEKAKDAQIVGIVMGTLGVKRYREMVARLKAVLRHAGKKFYTFIIGKVNVAKMANFMEIDIFVLVACPENSLIDSKEFYKPIVTPYEMELACLQTRQWTGDYITDFNEILPGGTTHVDVDDGTICSEPQYSLITGQLRSNPKLSEDQTKTCTDVSICNKENQILPYTASEYLSLRSWQGLEMNRGDTEIKKAADGRSGIAMSYENEG